MTIISQILMCGEAAKRQSDRASLSRINKTCNKLAPNGT